MLFLGPISGIVLLYVFAAIFPALFLMRYIYQEDKADKEPSGLLINLVIKGVFAALAAIVLELIMHSVLGLFTYPNNTIKTIIDAFIGVGLIEEATKFFFLYKSTWYNLDFNYRFDGIVFAVFVSLGFAAFENIQYIFTYGLSIALSRALFAIPAHMGFAVFMGLFYGRAKQRERRGDFFAMKFNLIMGYLAAVFLHGFYDSCAMINTDTANIVFIAFVAIMYLIVFLTIRKESSQDQLL